MFLDTFQSFENFLSMVYAKLRAQAYFRAKLYSHETKLYTLVSHETKRELEFGYKSGPRIPVLHDTSSERN